jgi:hypothetical protein
MLQFIKAELGQKFFFNNREIIITSYMTLGLYIDVSMSSKQALSLYFNMNSSFYTTKLLLWVVEAYLEDRKTLNASEFWMYASCLKESFEDLKLETVKNHLFPRLVALINDIQQHPELLLQLSQPLDHNCKIGDVINEWNLNPKDAEFISFVKNDHYRHIALATLPQIVFKDEDELQLRNVFDEFYARITREDNSLYWVQFQEIIYHTANTIFRSRFGWGSKKKRIALFTEFAQKILLHYIDNCKSTGSFNPLTLWKVLNILFTIEYENQFTDNAWEIMKQSVRLSLLRINEQTSPGKIRLGDIPVDIISEMHSLKNPIIGHSEIKDLFEMEDTEAKIQDNISTEDFFKYKMELEECIEKNPRISGQRKFNVKHMLKKVFVVLQNSNPLLYNITSLLESNSEGKGCVMLGWLMDTMIKEENSIPPKILVIIEQALESAIPDQTPQDNPLNSRSVAMITLLRKQDQKAVIVRNINEKVLSQISIVIKTTLVSLGYYQTTKAPTFIQDSQKQWKLLFRVIHLIFTRDDSTAKVTLINKDGDPITFDAQFDYFP